MLISPCVADFSPSPLAPLPQGERGIPHEKCSGICNIFPQLHSYPKNGERENPSPTTHSTLPTPLSPCGRGAGGEGEKIGGEGEKIGRNESPHQRNGKYTSRKDSIDQRNFAKGLRKNMTDAERLIWKHLRAHRLSGEKFRRQQPIGPYVVDFVHFGARLIIECDGGQHNESTYDRRRDTWLQKQGFRLIRFWNHEIMNETESVLTTIFTTLTPLSPCGRGAGGEGEQLGGEKEQITP